MSQPQFRYANKRALGDERQSARVRMLRRNHKMCAAGTSQLNSIIMGILLARPDRSPQYKMTIGKNSGEASFVSDRLQYGRRSVGCTRLTSFQIFLLFDSCSWEAYPLFIERPPRPTYGIAWNSLETRLFRRRAVWSTKLLHGCMNRVHLLRLSERSPDTLHQQYSPH